MGIQIAPSILTADFLNLSSELERIKSADLVHVDVMDNQFVTNLTIGPMVVERIVKEGPLPVDAHLMIADADRWAPQYAEMGCASVTFHAEAAIAPVKLARELRALGSKAALALRPGTDIAPYVDLLPEFDMILLMTVEPGFGGQKFLDVVLPKIERTRAAIAASGLEVRLQIDGGVSVETIERASAAGADVFVAGSAVYNAEDAAAEIATLRELARNSHRH
ncbi:ribulose-5-phosphate 3-epimerase [Ruaniaceae bacterium KH17]|nr:ribulose-5-phosphate 3-epimerase [Ruaniaceae bacterium KH17]